MMEEENNEDNGEAVSCVTKNVHEAAGKKLTFVNRFSYGVGHVLNDLCASMWFSYLLVFFHYVIQFSNDMAGYLLLLGQVADAICTPLVGFESDRANGFCGYGKRKSWHLLGTICVVISFPFLFNKCIMCDQCNPDHPTDLKQSCWPQFAYYAPFVVIFQFGWAATQISHLSMIPQLSSSETIRVELNAIRYSFTVISNTVVYVIAWALLRSFMADDKSADSSTGRIGAGDASVFRILSATVVAVGIIFSIIFHAGTPEKRTNVPCSGRDKALSSNENCEIQECQSSNVQRVQKDSRVDRSGKDISPSQGEMEWSDWFKEIQFYQIAALYMCTRLVVNISQIYMPMYLTDSLELKKHYIAIVPLVIFLSGFAASLVMRPVTALIGKKFTYTIGSVIVVVSCVWMWFISTVLNKMMIFGAAVLLGFGNSIMLVTSLAMTADLIGRHTKSGAFVYGCMSFTDKLSNGIAVVIIQHLHPCKSEACCSACVWFYRDTLVFVTGGVAVAAIFVLLSLSMVKIGNLKKYPETITLVVSADENMPLLQSESNNSTINTFSQNICCNFCVKRQKIVPVRQDCDNTSYHSVSVQGDPHDIGPIQVPSDSENESLIPERTVVRRSPIAVGSYGT